MAERKTGLPVDPTSSIFTQILSPFAPMSYQVDKPYSVEQSEPIDGAVYYKETPMEASDFQFATPPIITGGIDFFKQLIEDPTETASGIMTAVGQELEEYPKRQVRTAMAGGEYLNPETGEVERYDPFSVPATTALGTARSIAQAEGLGPFIGMLGGKPVNNSLVNKFGFYQDNPDLDRGNNDYTRENIEYLERTRPEGDDFLRGPQTALLGVELPHVNVRAEKPFTLPSAFLNDLPGAANETRMAGDPQFDRLMESVREEGFDPDQKGNRVVVGVNHLGQAYLLEGNTRAAVAAASGVPNIRAEVRYFNGAEMIDGPFSPQRMAAYSEVGTGGEIFGMMGGRKSRPTDLVTARDLGGARMGIEGMAHGVKRGENASPNITIRMSNLDNLDASMEGPKQKLLDYAYANSLVGQDGNITIDRAEFITLMGLDNEVRSKFTPSSKAKSAEVNRQGFSVSGDPYLSYKNFAGEAGVHSNMDDLLVAEISGLRASEVQDLSPSEYLLAAYDPEKRVLKKPNTRFFEDESHLGKDSQDYTNMRPMSDLERSRFRRVVLKNDYALRNAIDASDKLVSDPLNIVDSAQKIVKSFDISEGPYAERRLELASLIRLQHLFNDPDAVEKLEGVLGESGVRELYLFSKNYADARNKSVGDEQLNIAVKNEHAQALENVIKEELLPTYPEFADHFKAEFGGLTFFKTPPKLLTAMDIHADNLRELEKAEYALDLSKKPMGVVDLLENDGVTATSAPVVNPQKVAEATKLRDIALNKLEKSTAAIKEIPLSKHFTFEDPDTGRLMFRDREGNFMAAPPTMQLETNINSILRYIDEIRDDGTVNKKARLDKVMSMIDNGVPANFAEPLRHLARNTEAISLKRNAGVNSRPKARELNKAYRDYKTATYELIEHLRRIADLGPRNTVSIRTEPTVPFKDITVRDNPAVKFEKGGPVKAGIGEFIQYMQ